MVGQRERGRAWKEGPEKASGVAEAERGKRVAVVRQAGYGQSNRYA